ncbi:MAG: hypothetical protein KatS3mg126_2425 [Lysobacteraceae bacterium]|nr:MAG: hypothetical protein KatS3mg126_2425 [Xanthomonadaceae bacterium]
MHRGRRHAIARRQPGMSTFLIGYDIRDPGRLRRVHRLLGKHALPLQYSVFLFCGDARQLARLLDRLVPLCDGKEDDLRAYPLPRQSLKLRLGRGVLPEGIHWEPLADAW